MQTNTPQDLALVVERIQTSAELAAEPFVLTVECPDGDGGTMSLPILALRQGDGEVRVHALVEEFKQGSELAKKLRLDTAAGPDARVGNANHQSLASLIQHTNRFKDGGSAVWADASSRRLVSVLDYHPEGAETPARWGRHRGHYQCPFSEAWQAWGGGKTLDLDQDAFAALLDSRDRELAPGKLPTGKEAPDPSALVTLATNLEVYSSATAKRERDPNTGRVRISYSEDKGVSGAVMPPPAFLIRIRVFEDGEPQVLEVRLRVTVQDGAALFALAIHAAGEVVRDAFAEVCTRVGAETSLPVFVGTPE